jgi:hypothetical protein
MAFRDFENRSRMLSAEASETAAAWRARLRESPRLSEEDGLRMLSQFGLAIPRLAAVCSTEELETALAELRYPVALKTAEDHAHKSDVGGVALGIESKARVRELYKTMSAALGPRALLMEMAPSGIELSLGAIFDESFGPVVLISAGGTLIEFLDDSVPVLAPIDAGAAHKFLGELRIARLLSGVRGQTPADLDEVARQIACFSQMIAALGDAFSEIDVNPLICSSQGVFAVDCLAVAR